LEMLRLIRQRIITHRGGLSLVLFLGGVATVCLAADAPGHDWPQFGGDVASPSASPDPTGITAANAGSLVRHQVELDGVADSSAIYLHDVMVKGAKHNVFFLTTAYGKTLAVDAEKAAILWEYTPPKYDSWNKTAQITNSTPAADPDRLHIYAAAPDGIIRKLTVADGKEVWTTAITRLPAREKMDSPLKVFHGHVIAVTGGYIGDRPPYQGHVVILDAKDGKLLHVWNSLCSDRAELLIPDSCAATRSAIWGRSGAVIDPATGNIFVATGNGPYDGKTSWGDALIELDPNATKIIGNWTPSDNAQLEARDADMGSASPVLLGGGYLAQGGKGKLFHLMSIDSLAGATPHQNDKPVTLSTPSGDRLFTSSAVWHHGGDTLMFAADGGGTAAWTFRDGQLSQVWKNSNGGTSPVVAGGLLYVYDAAGKLRIYDAEKGTKVAELECGPGHWESPIVVDGKIALPEGNSRRQAPASGVFNIWTLPAK
jgi:outer membrane protein assembly factor BamB